MDKHLQAIIGTDKKNPNFTVFRNSKEKTIIIYFGAALIETIPEEPGSRALKHLVARLFNAGVKKSALTKTFGWSYNAIKRWADALKSGDSETINIALSGQGAPKKIITEIRSFIVHRFNSIYPENKYSYSKEIREEIQDVFKLEICAESLRPIFAELKTNFEQKKKRTHIK